MRILRFVVLILILVAPVAAQPASVRPGELLVYYAWPSVINGATTVAQAAEALGQYDVVVLGDGLQIDTHPDYTNTVAILAHPAMANTTVFGYVDLGVTTQNLPSAEYKLRMVWWTDIGADGIFLDDFGYDFGVSRERQNDAVEFAHALEVPVMVNAWDPDDAFSRDVDPQYNPNERRAVLQAGDFYFSESFLIEQGGFQDAAFWREKADKVERYRQSFGVGVMSITTPGAAYDEAQFHYAWHGAAIDGHAATGWGEPSFSAADAVAPYRARPAVDPGAAFTGEAVAALPLVSRETDTGTLFVDTDAHTYGFTLRQGTATEAPDESADGFALGRPFPHPVGGASTLPVTLDVPGSIRLYVVDILGREVAELAGGFYAAGSHDIALDAWSLPAGVYLARLEAGGLAVSRLWVKR